MQLMHYQIDSPKMIQTADDALSNIELGDSDEDILNEVHKISQHMNLY